MQDVVTPQPAIMKMGINQGDIRLVFFQFPDRLGGTVGNRDHDDVVAPARESIRDQVRAHAVRIRDEDTDAGAERL